MLIFFRKKYFGIVHIMYIQYTNIVINGTKLQESKTGSWNGEGMCRNSKLNLDLLNSFQ